VKLEVNAVRALMKKLVDVPFVIVAFVKTEVVPPPPPLPISENATPFIVFTVRLDIDALVENIFVEVEFVIVALVTFKSVILPVVIFAVTIFEVDAFVVLALLVAKLEVVPHKVVMFAKIEFSKLVKKLVEVEFVIEEFTEKIFVLVEFVIVASAKYEEDPELNPEKGTPFKLEIFRFVTVPLVASKFAVTTSDAISEVLA
jgi:hypothetical protein